MESLRQFNEREIRWDAVFAIFFGIGFYLDFVCGLSLIALLPILVFTVRLVVINGKFFANCDTSEKLQILKDYVEKDMEKRFAWTFISGILFIVIMIWFSFSPRQGFVYLLITFSSFAAFRSAHKSLLWIASRQAKPINSDD